MPQRDLLLPWRTVIDNAVIPMEIEGRSRKAARAEAREDAARVRPCGFGDQYPHQLSGGMRQRVALMRTFMFKRELMLLDEPFGALDALTRTMMQRWLLEVWRKHRRTILFITHDVDEALFLGDRVLVMSARPGRVKLELPVSSTPALRRARHRPGIRAPEAHPAGSHRGGGHEVLPRPRRFRHPLMDHPMTATDTTAACPAHMDPSEWDARVALAACYRMVAKLGLDDLIYNHISSRVPGHEDQFLINPYGLLFSEMTASSLVKIDIEGRSSCRKHPMR